MDKYFGLRVLVSQVGILKHKFPDSTVRMPCGHTATITETDQQCPNSGQCAAGHGECWIEKYDPV